METLRYYPIIDTKPNTEKIRKQVQAELWKNMLFTDDINQANAILVCWWDWFMLDVIKEHCQTKDKVFVWMNYGTLGFLLNNIQDIAELPKTKEELDIIKEIIPKVTIQCENGDKHTTHAVNDIVIGQSIFDYYSFDIQYWRENRHIKWTGMILSTPIGSSAYRLGNWWQIMPLNSEIRGIMWIASAPFKYEYLIPQHTQITVQGKTLPDIWIDGYGRGYFQNAKKVTIEPNGTNIEIWFLKKEQFDRKRLLLATQKL